MSLYKTKSRLNDAFWEWQPKIWFYYFFDMICEYGRCWLQRKWLSECDWMSPEKKERKRRRCNCGDKLLAAFIPFASTHLHINHIVCAIVFMVAANLTTFNIILIFLDFSQFFTKINQFFLIAKIICSSFFNFHNSQNFQALCCPILHAKLIDPFLAAWIYRSLQTKTFE